MCRSGAAGHVPPRRARSADTRPLAKPTAARAAREQGRKVHGIELEAARLLAGYAWPGNVRELRHVIERAVALADASILHSALLPAEIKGKPQPEKGELMLSLRGDWRNARAQFDRPSSTPRIERCQAHLTQVSKARRDNRLGRLADEDLTAVEQPIRVQLSLTP